MPDKLSGTLSQNGKLSGVLSTKNRLTGQLSMAVDAVFNDDYNKLKEDTLPQINSVALKGNKLSSELHVQHEMNAISYQDIDELLFG